MFNFKKLHYKKANFKKNLLAALILSTSFAHAAGVKQADTQRILITPNCLVKNIHTDYQTLARTKSLSLIAVNKSAITQINETKSQSPCGGFRDVTRAWKKSSAKERTHFLDHATKSHHAMLAAPHNAYKIQYRPQVDALFSQLNPQNMMDNLNYLSSFQDRYADSQSGVQAAEWLKSQVESMAATFQRNDVKVSFLATDGFAQPSVIVKVGDSSEPGIVIGAHMDTVQSISSRKPGADDDGSGTVTVLETVRSVLASGMHFKRPLYFVWYAAEEEGLIGSDQVVASFKEKNIPVAAVMHFDLTGYKHNGEPTMWLIDDYVDDDLTAYLETLIKTYVKQPVKHTQCGYACSDHASWSQAGFTTAMPAEARFEDSNPNMHSSRDTTDKLSLDHMSDYLKLAAAFTVEMAEPVTK